MSGPPHTWFLAADVPHRWTRDLELLWRHLSASTSALEGATAWVRLPGGAEVALRVRLEDMRKELRIARSEAPSPGSEPKWEQELEVFLKYMPAPYGGGWYRLGATVQPKRGEAVAARFVQLYKGETAPGKGVCCGCGQEVEYDARLTDWQLCRSCKDLAHLARAKQQRDARIDAIGATPMTPVRGER